MADLSRLEPLVRLGGARLSTDSAHRMRDRDRISVANDVATVISCTVCACAASPTAQALRNRVEHMRQV
jgi:hypothetical protein